MWYERSDRRIALCDVNNFYASCEAVFNPALQGKAVVVLSNNDGCVVSRSAEAKALAIRMAEPWHLVPKHIQAKTFACSSNYALYADMSNRVMSILSDLAPEMEMYSIDEAFLDLTGIAHLHQHAFLLRQRILQWTGLTTSVGIGSTKTRAKLANHIAKQEPKHANVFNLEDLSPSQEQQLMESIPVGEIWGVGYRLRKHLQTLGIRTVADLKATDPSMMRHRFSVVVERMVHELRGVSCLEVEQIPAAKQQILSSRSFGRTVMCVDELKEAIVAFVSRAAEKLRKQGSIASALNVFLATNSFASEQPQYFNRQMVSLPHATDDTLTLSKAASWAISQLYRPGYAYKKAGVMLWQLEPKKAAQRSLFENTDTIASKEKLNTVLDHIHKRYGRDTLMVGRTKGLKRWSTNRNRMSPRYTTCMEELLVVR